MGYTDCKIVHTSWDQHDKEKCLYMYISLYELHYEKISFDNVQAARAQIDCPFL